jgi:hypothetical protein
LTVVVCDESRRADWEELTAQSADATIGHLWEWRDLVGAAYGVDSFYLMAQDNRGRAVAGAPFVFVRSLLYGSELASMPYIDYGGVCHDNSLDQTARVAADAELVASARELASKLRAKRLHIRSLQQMQPPFEVSTEKVAQHRSVAIGSSESESWGSARRSEIRLTRRRWRTSAASTRRISATSDRRRIAGGSSANLWRGSATDCH